MGLRACGGGHTGRWRLRGAGQQRILLPGMKRPDQLRPRGGRGCSLGLLPDMFGVSSLILEVVHSLSKKLVGNQIIRRNISLFTCKTDVLL